MRCENQGLTSLPPQLWLKTTLRTLVLTGNALACLPPDIQLLKELRELHLGHNQLAQLPDELCLLSQLQHLDVQHNQLTEVPAGLCRWVGSTPNSIMFAIKATAVGGTKRTIEVCRNKLCPRVMKPA